MRPRWIALLSASIAVLTGVMVWVAVGAGIGMGGGFPGMRGSDVESSEFTATEFFTVSPDGGLTPEPGERARRVWDELIRVTTVEFAASEIREYQVGDDADSDTLAYVASASDDPTKWAFAANLAYADDEDLLLSTLVHEYAHLRSLGEDDADPSAVECETEWTGSGCLLPDADLERFAQQFWSDYTDAPARDNVDSDVAWDFYQAHEDDFVSDYAATNASEDFAETFATYVVEPDGPRSGVIAEKFAFFDALPEYAGARERIRAEFDLG
ncbi:NADH:ubiquinone oxidoreductase subunit 4 (chain M) [Microbacterium enclense]|uniref:NADH:ubiquinone oxidoreductase subunit 4 (chain M) n=1 Tax=Microbacterium enclense TaxID=993073 RepID=UPI0021A2FF75|nr:NADH:ubiquinone oxidoreductase subunit 4 (chain M) [Microbacterium enclense]MCT2086932.1 NADH:ubiquinone oxidoreductase subunit 4 (chain M) [Microbacterium enclense]